MSSEQLINGDMKGRASPDEIEKKKPDYQSLRALIQEHANVRGDKAFIVCPDQNRRITFFELARYCLRISNALSARDIWAGDIVSVLGKNSAETLLAFIGVLYHGSVVNPINFEESSGNVHKILTKAQPRLLIHDHDFQLSNAEIRNTEMVPFSVGSDHAGGDGDFFATLPEATDVSRPLPTPDPEALAEVVFTSGTMSVPKGVCIASGPLHAMAMEVIDRLGVTADDTLLEYRNYNWLSAQLLTILASTIAGATLVFGQKFSRSKFPEWLEKYKVTIAAGVPTVINILVKNPVNISEEVRSSLRFITSSSAPLAPASQEAFEELYGIPVLQMAGMSEAGFMLGSAPTEVRIGSAGRPTRFKEIYFVDGAGERCASGVEGEMVVRGYSMGAGYLQEDGEIERFSPDGFRTGDLGYTDQDGFIYITGRAKDLIIRGGVNIAPAEITACLLEHPMIADAATIGVPDPIYGEDVAAAVVLKNGATIQPQELIDYCLAQLPPFKAPKKLVLVDVLPKNARGKVSKPELTAIMNANAQ